MEKKPIILISNDDGFDAKGINDLAEMVRPYGDVVIVAPEGGRSGASMAMTSAEPVRVRKISEEPGLQVYACTGTPCDCVKIAFKTVLTAPPALILAGINHGDNASVNVHYSGTMAVALEGCLKHIPSVGFSSCKREADADFTALRPYVQQIVQRVLKEGLPPQICLNVNFPVAEEFKGVRMCKMDIGDWLNEWEERTDPRGRQYFWLTGYYEPGQPHDETTDRWALNNGFVAITPIQLDMTAYAAMDGLKQMLQF